ncbi:MAG: TRAP transporter substrate-binding protein DctP [Pseudomonadota bacterium]
MNRYGLILLVWLFSYGAMAADETQRFHLVVVSGDYDSPQGTSMRLWAKLVDERSQGRLSINVFYQNELGGQQEIFDQLLKGNLHMVLAWPQTAYDQRMGVSFLPYLTIGWDDALAAYARDGWLTQVVAGVYAENGLKYFGPYPEGFGGIATKGRYTTSIDNTAGIKLRSQTIFPLPQTISAMGFDAVPIDWSEVYTSLQTGVVDGDSSNVIYWDYEYFGDLLDYFVHTKHNFSAAALVMNNEVWLNLSDADKQIFEDTADIVIRKQFADAKTEDDKWIATAQANGMAYFVPNTAEMQSWVRTVRDKVWPQAETFLGPAIMQTVRDNASVPE